MQILLVKNMVFWLPIAYALACLFILFSIYQYLHFQDNWYMSGILSVIVWFQMKFILQMFGIYYSDGSASDGGDINSFTADPSKAAEVSIKSLVARSKFSAPQRE